MATPGDFLSGIVGNSTVKALFEWQVAGSIVSALMAPFTDELTQQVAERFPDRQLSPEVLADLVLRGWTDQDTAAGAAKRSGINPEKFQLLVDGAGEPPGLMQLLEAYRRQIIDQARLIKGIKESRVRDEWADVVEQLRYAPPPAAEVLAGWVQNHLDPPQAEKLLIEAGVDPVNHEWLYEAHGRPPGIQEMLRELNRGVISEADVVQSIRESDIKDKYIPAILRLREYLPPVRTVTALHRSGAITDERAAQLYAENGVRPQDITAYVAEAHHVKTTAHKELAVSEVATLYEERAITHAEALNMIMAVGYDQAEAEFILEIYDLRAWRRAYDAMINRVRTLYIGRHIDATTAIADMGRAQVPAEQQKQLLELWDLAREANRTLLTPAQILKGHKDGVLSDEVTTQKLVQHGYTAEDAHYLLLIDG